MTTQELKNKIEKVLGNSIRCLLPSYWWKNIFHSVADRIDEVETTVTENVNDMVVKSLKEFEAKHPDMASNTLILTEDETSAEARNNAIKLMRWAAKVTTSPAKFAVNPLYIAVPILDEEFAYSIQTPSYGLGRKGVIFYGVRMLGGQAFNIEFDFDTGVATLESTSESEGGGLVFVCGIDIFAQELSVITSEEDKENNKKSYEEYLGLIQSGKPANLKMRYYYAGQNGAKAYYTDVYPKIAGYNPFTFPQYGGISFCDVEVLTAKMDFVFGEGGEVSVCPHATLGEPNYVYAAYNGLSLNDVQIYNNKTMYQYMLKGKRLPVVVRMMYPLGEAVFSSRWFQYEEDGTTKIRFFAFGEELFHMELTEDGEMTILGTIPIGGSSGGVEIRELRTNSNLSDEDKAYNIETIELYKEDKALVVTPIVYYQTSTERTDRMAAPFFVDLHTGDSTKLATFRFLVPQMDETDPFERGFMQEATVVIYNDGSVSVTGGSFYDVAMSDTSTKAVQNKVIKKYIDDAIANVEGGGGSNIVVDTEMSSTSTNPVQNKVVYSELQKKQGTITDLADIRSGAALGKTALQSVPSEYVTESELTQKGYATTSQVNDKQDRIDDLEAIRSGAAKGATALQSEQYKGTVTSVKINGTTKNPSSGIVDLGTVITAHQDISHLATKEELNSLTNEIISNERVHAASLVDIDARIQDIVTRLNNAGL